MNDGGGNGDYEVLMMLMSLTCSPRDMMFQILCSLISHRLIRFGWGRVLCFLDLNRMIVNLMQRKRFFMKSFSTRKQPSQLNICNLLSQLLITMRRERIREASSRSSC